MVWGGWRPLWDSLDCVPMYCGAHKLKQLQKRSIFPRVGSEKVPRGHREVMLSPSLEMFQRPNWAESQALLPMNLFELEALSPPVSSLNSPCLVRGRWGGSRCVTPTGGLWHLLAGLRHLHPSSRRVVLSFSSATPCTC